MRRDAGFTYLFVLILLATTAASLLAAANRWSDDNQRSKERALLRSGHEIRHAIGSYYESSPGSVKRYPPDLQALLLDQRFVSTRRHLRRIPLDPMSLQADWRLISSPDGGIMGVASPFDGAPFKTGGFSREDETLAGKSRYADWEFTYSPKPVAR